MALGPRRVGLQKLDERRSSRGVRRPDTTHNRAPAGRLGLVAAPYGYVVPGLLSWSGAANVNLDGADQVAILKLWHDRFGAELVALGFDIVELYVPRPPTDAETALAVAEEQWVYCPDAVDQGVGDLDMLAAVQVRSHRWSFWWD
jgi:hypothetical protein